MVSFLKTLQQYVLTTSSFFSVEGSGGGSVSPLHPVKNLWFQYLPRVLQMRAGKPISSFHRLVRSDPCIPPPRSVMQASSCVGLFRALWAKKRDCHSAAGTLMAVAMQHFHTVWLLWTNLHVTPQGGCSSNVCHRDGTTVTRCDLLCLGFSKNYSFENF